MANRMNRRHLLAVCLAPVCLPSWGASPDLLLQISQQIASYAVVRAEFVQTKKMVALKRPLVSRGRMIFSQKEGVFWLIEEPLRISYWLGEQKMVEVNAEGQRKEQDTKSNPALSQMARVMRSMLGAQSELLKENFELKARGSIAQWELELTPRQAQLAQFIHSIQVSGGRFIESMRLQETSGDTTHTRFSHSEALRDVPAADMQRFGKAS